MTINLDQDAILSGSFATNLDGFVTVNGGYNSYLNDYSANMFGGSATINVGLSGTGTMILSGNISVSDATLTLGGTVGAGETISIRAGHLLLNAPTQFNGSIDWTADGSGWSRVDFTGIRADSYSYDGTILHFYSADHDVYDAHVDFPDGLPAHIFQTTSGVAVTYYPLYDPTATALPERAGPANYLVSDVTKSLTNVRAGVSYSGGVDYLKSQFVMLTSDNVNVVPLIDNVFVHTGAGNDAISFAGKSGRNVADGGTGSNFLTGGNGNDTFFDDARGATRDLWNTIVNFHPGDATTLWGVTSKDFALSWVDSDGASGAKGLTLHAISRADGGPTISVTFAGHSMADLGNLTMIQDTKSNYTYLLQN